MPWAACKSGERGYLHVTLLHTAVLRGMMVAPQVQGMAVHCHLELALTSTSHRRTKPSSEALMTTLLRSVQTRRVIRPLGPDSLRTTLSFWSAMSLAMLTKWIADASAMKGSVLRTACTKTREMESALDENAIKGNLQSGLLAHPRSSRACEGTGCEGSEGSGQKRGCLHAPSGKAASQGRSAAGALGACAEDCLFTRGAR